MRRLIALFTEPDEVVLDCFNGSGTTTLAAAQLGRRYLGIEASEETRELHAPDCRLTRARSRAWSGSSCSRARRFPRGRPRVCFHIARIGAT